MTFKPLITSTLVKPTNQKVGSYLGKKMKKTEYNESTVRSWKKKDEEYYDKMLLEYLLDKAPFITEKSYKEHFNVEEDLKEQVLNGTIPGVVYKNKVLVPPQLKDILENKKIIKDFNECNVISVANFKGGVSKTTSSLQIASSLAFYGYRVLIVDVDGQGNSTSLFDLNRTKINSKVDTTIFKPEELYDFEESDFNYSIVDLLAEVENDNIEKLVRDSVISLKDKVNVLGTLDILPNDNSLENSLKFEHLDTTLTAYGNTNQALDEILSFLKNDYDFMILDTPPSITLPLRLSVLATDYFLIALAPDKMSKDGIAPFIAPIELNSKAYKRLKGKDITILGGFISNYQPNLNVHKMNEKIIAEDIINIVRNSNLGESELFKQVLKRDNAITEAQAKNGVVLFHEPTLEIVREYFNLTDEIIDKIIIDKYSKMN